MQYPIAMALLVASVPIILGLCRAIGPGRAAPYAILGAFLIQPRYTPDEKIFGIFTVDKLTIAGLSMTLGVLFFDRKTLARARLRWVDGPMLLYIVAPFIGLVAGKSRDYQGACDQAWMTFAQWGVPYALSRLYFSDRDGPRRLSIAVVVAALLYIPFCVYEMTMGEGWFLRLVIFQIPTGASFRLGGWRPMVMLTSGLELVTWMALATVLSTWLWACRERWSTRYLPAWLPPLALLITTIACRGVYGYVLLILGLLAIGLLLLSRSKWVLTPLLLVPVAYIGLRSTGIWDGQVLVRLAEFFGERARGSVALRLVMEDQFIRETTEQGLALGMGGRYAESWADGWWLILLKRGGLLAVACHYAVFLLPAALFLLRKSSRSVVASASAGLAIFLILHMIDSLHNTPLIAVSTLLGGSLAGMFLGESGWSRTRSATRPRPASTGAGHATYRVGEVGAAPVRPVDVHEPVGFVLATACLLYVFGHAVVEGQDQAKFLGGLGSALLFASVGGAVAGSPRRSLARVAGFALAFGAMGITFNLGLHPSGRPVLSSDILQGMAFSGLVVACWRRLTGGGSWAFAGLVALASTWWAFEPFARPFPGSQYLYATNGVGPSLFPLLPWLALAALGAVLVEASTAIRAALAVILGVGASLAWGGGSPFGPAVKFPLNPTYALAGGSLASAAFALAGPARSWRPVAVASDWLGHRWLVFFYLHLGIATALKAAGVTRPIAGWSALLVLSLVATWLVSSASGLVRAPSRHPATWLVLFAATLAVGLAPGIPVVAVLALAGGIGLLFASRYGDLAELTLGPVLHEDRLRQTSAAELSMPRYLAILAVVVAVLVAPELVARLPAPFGIAARREPPLASPGAPR